MKKTIIKVFYVDEMIFKIKNKEEIFFDSIFFRARKEVKKISRGFRNLTIIEQNSILLQSLSLELNIKKSLNKTKTKEQ